VRREVGRWDWERRGASLLIAADGTPGGTVGNAPRRRAVSGRHRATAGPRGRDLDAVEIGCGAGIVSWVGPSEAKQLWRRVEPLLDEVEYYPPSHYPGEYRAELWRAEDGRHVMVFDDE